LQRSVDSRQYERMVRRRISKKLRIAELPLKFTPLEVEFAKKILNLRPNTIASLSKFCAKPATLRHAYCSLLELEPVIVGRYLSQADFDSALSDICDYFGLDGDPPLKVMLISKESMASVMQLLLDVKKNL
ncbi:MAG: hypothetical protein N3G76_01265, partial [Candidatus Micrarchaeota archaeon]|nr:hypothetical protein [Candidatus Micrarchaeota archaeon]